MTTTIPEVLPRLVEIFQQAVPDARVDDGPTSKQIEVDESYDGLGAGDFGIICGWQLDGPAVSSETTRAGGAADHREVYQVHCQITASSGDEDTLKLRKRVFDAFEAIEAQLKAAHPISRGVLAAWIDFVDYHAQQVDNNQVEATIQFAVFVDAFAR